MSSTLRLEYENRVTRFGEQLRRLKQSELRVAWLRAAVFLAALILFFVFIGSSVIFGILVPVALLFVFVYLVQLSSGLRTRVLHQQNLVAVNEDELAFLRGDLSPFKTGEEYQDYHHAYSYDLDIFGRHSVYQLLDRTGTVPGREKLARCLQEIETDSGQIAKKQQAVQELTNELDWRQEFLATSRQIAFEKDETAELRKWLTGADLFLSGALYPVLFVLVPLIGVAIPVLVGFNILSVWWLLWYLLPLALVAFQARRILHEQNRLGRFVNLFRKYSGLLLLIEEADFTADYLRDKQDELKTREIAASAIVKKLSGIQWGLETRNNLIMAFLLNAFVLWDIRYMVTLEKWRRDYGSAFLRWLEVIADVEVHNSLAAFAYNRQDLVYPELSEEPFRIVMEDGGHPLLDPSVRVDNDIAFSGPGQIKIVTGANMAGKSTLLRTVGVNLILAMMGAPVCARKFEFYPMRLRTSVRTNDSLGDSESYFYAELVKLQRIMEELKTEGPLFVIVDEMLKGTNSRDKHRGSVGLIRQLVSLGAVGLVATHDIQLGQLIDEFPEKVENKCFEVEIRADQLVFDYRLRSGISQNLNATFLMAKMGIIEKSTFTE